MQRSEQTYFNGRALTRRCMVVPSGRDRKWCVSSALNASCQRDQTIVGNGLLNVLAQKCKRGKEQIQSASYALGLVYANSRLHEVHCAHPFKRGVHLKVSVVLHESIVEINS